MCSSQQKTLAIVPQAPHVLSRETAPLTAHGGWGLYAAFSFFLFLLPVFLRVLFFLFSFVFGWWVFHAKSERARATARDKEQEQRATPIGHQLPFFTLR